jgi:hypothetical protein
MPGTRDKFHDVYVKQSLPLQQKWKINVVAFGPSLHDEITYWVVRSFNSLEDWKKSTAAFYASDDWQKGPRAVILAMIDHLSSMVVSPETVRSWTENMGK